MLLLNLSVDFNLSVDSALSGNNFNKTNNAIRQ